MSSTNLAALIVQAQSELDGGSTKKDFVLRKLQLTGLNSEVASILIDDIVMVMKSQEAMTLFHDSGILCKRWCCRK